MLHLKKATKQDISEIHHLQKLAFKKLFDKYQDQESPFNEPESSILEKFKQANNYFFLIKNAEESIGYIRIVTNDNQTTAKFSQIAINPRYDGQGFGTQAVELLEKEFPYVKEWSLGTIFQEKKLVHFYSKIGYEITGNLLPIQENMDLVFFKKQIN